MESINGDETKSKKTIIIVLVFVIIIAICIFYILYNGNEGGGGTRGHTSYTYIVTPPLPDNHSEITLFVYCKIKVQSFAKKKCRDLHLFC